MTFELSKQSQDKLNTCHPALIKLMEAAIKSSSIDFSIVCGHRNSRNQTKAYLDGASKVKYPNSRHNKYPSLAVDIQPFPYTKEDRKDKEHTKFRLLSEHIGKIASELEIPVINGGRDWGWDWYHWELVK